MPALPVITNVIRTTLTWALTNGLPAANVMHFQGPGTVTQLFAALGANLTSELTETMSIDCALTGMAFLPLDGSSGTTVEVLDGTFKGQDITDAIVQCATIVSLSTGLRGPANRGRIYLPATAEGSQDRGVLDPTKRATQDDAWKDFVVAMEVDGWTLGVASYVHSEFNQVTDINVKPVVATQRRRLDALR